jgi:hypothetical protein
MLQLSRLTSAVAAAAALLASMLTPLAPSAGVAHAGSALFELAATDRITLKNGKVVEGTILKELDGYIWIRTRSSGIEREEVLAPTDILRIERGTAPAAPAADATAKPAAEPATTAAPGTRISGAAPRAVVLTLGGPEGDMVGLYMTAKVLQEILPTLEQELGPKGERERIVVFRVTSGGGLGLEVQRISDVIHNEYKPRFRTVAWIQSAISAAAMSAHCMDEIYFTPQGNYGACTGWSGQLQAVKDRGLEEMLFQMEKISARGNHDPRIMRAMQIDDPLSADIDANGDVTWYQNEDGRYVLNRRGYILTFNAQQAREFKFSRGTALTLDELRQAMNLTEVEWIGKPTKGSIWPISRSEEANIRFRKQVKEDEERQNEYFTLYQVAMNLAEQLRGDKDRQSKVIKIARDNLDNIERMVRNNPNFALLIGLLPDQFKEWMEEQRKRIRDLAR